MDGAVITGTLLRCIRLAVLSTAAFSALFGAGYFVYRRRLHGEKPFPRRLWLWLAVLVGWAAVVLGLTLFWRISGEETISRAGYTGFNPCLLRCYVNAWNERSPVGVQLIVFNILMFVPLGALLPFWKEKGIGARAACFVSLLATVSVEVLQLITGRGCCDVDDIVHNWLGAMLGYFAAVFLRELARTKQPDKRLFWRVPAILLVMGAVALSGLAACGLQRWSALQLTPLQKPPQAAQEGKHASLFSRQAAAGRGTPGESTIPVFAALFGGGRAAAQAYCDGLAHPLQVSVIAGFAHIRFGGMQLSVPEVLQLPQLPNGCEATSLAALLQYRGFPANKLDLAYGYIPRGDFTESMYGSIGPDPERAYAGDPATDNGFYCFAAPLAQGANRYLHELGSSMHAFNITGVTGEGLRQYIRGGDPVVVWITLDLSEPYRGDLFVWFVGNTGRLYIPYANLHCVVLMGWGQDTCTLMDPLQGICTVDQQAFLRCFEQMGRRALVIH